MHHPALLIITIALAVAATPSIAQTGDVQHDAQLWALVTAEGTLHGPALYSLEAQPRISLDAGGPYQTLLRGAAGFAFTDWFSLWAGAAWIPSTSWPDNKPLSAGEGRFFQQLTLTGKWLGATVVSRSRFEQRAIAGVDDVSLRGRTMLRVVVPVALDDTIYLAVYDEIFGVFSDARTGPPRGFDQNRAFVGAGWRATASTAFETGYINRTTRDLRMDHAWLMWLAFRFS